MKVHGGVVTVESLPSKGSVFRVFFPISAEEMIHKQDKRVNVQKIQETGKILLVDDDKTVLEISSVMLSILGFTVLTAVNGIEAVNVFQQHKNEIRLVLSDVSMPRMNGWETLDALRQIMPGIPVIFASGYSEDQVMQEVHSERPQAFLGKPYGMDALRDTIHRVLQETKK